MKSLWLCVTVLLTLGFSAAARGQNKNKELTREVAKNLLNASDSWTEHFPTWNIQGPILECGKREGLWARIGQVGWNLTLTQKGATILTHVSGFSDTSGSITVREKRHVVEITGIADVPMADGNGKRVELNWASDKYEFPATLKPCTNPKVQFIPEGTQTGKDVQYFTLYDDGWRVGQ